MVLCPFVKKDLLKQKRFQKNYKRKTLKWVYAVELDLFKFFTSENDSEL
jgi:hypothetical protein